MLNPESEWFGFRHVRPEDKTGLVREVFNSVASRYDLMNDLMSGGLHRLWKDRLVSLMNPRAGDVILDVAGGTGDIALRCLKRTNGNANITVCDINPAMLKEGRDKMIDHGILPAAPFHSLPLAGRVREGGGRPGQKAGSRKQSPHQASLPHPRPLPQGEGRMQWITGNAEDLPLPARRVDIYCIAFGLRNVTHIDKALREAARVLKPGGRFYCLEFSPGVRREIKPFYDRYCLGVLPWLGQFIAKDRDAYRYLAESIQKFPGQAALTRRMESAGLSQVKWLNLTGGIAVIHWGWKV